MPGRLDARVIGALIALGAGVYIASAGSRQPDDGAAERAASCTCLPRGAAAGTALIGLGATPVRLPPPGTGWRRSRWCRGWRAANRPRGLGTRAGPRPPPPRPGAAALVREMRHGARRRGRSRSGIFPRRRGRAPVGRGSPTARLAVAGASSAAGGCPRHRCRRRAGRRALRAFATCRRAHSLEDSYRLRLVYRSRAPADRGRGPALALPRRPARRLRRDAGRRGGRSRRRGCRPSRPARTRSRPSAPRRSADASAWSSRSATTSTSCAPARRCCSAEPGAAAVEARLPRADGPLAAAARAAIATRQAVYRHAHRLVDPARGRRRRGAAAGGVVDATRRRAARARRRRAAGGRGWLAALRRARQSASRPMLGATLIAPTARCSTRAARFRPAQAHRTRFVGLPAADLPAAASCRPVW